MLRMALAILIFVLVTALLGFTGIASNSIPIVSVIFLVLFALFLGAVAMKTSIRLAPYSRDRLPHGSRKRAALVRLTDGPGSLAVIDVKRTSPKGQSGGGTVRPLQWPHPRR